MHRLLVTLVFIIIFFMNFIPVKDTDFGWHYRCGADLMNGAPCTSNTYSYFLPDYQSYNSSFLFDGITAITYDQLGFLGLSIVHAGIMTLLAFLFFKQTRLNLYSCLTFLGVLFFSWPILALGWRSQILSLVFFFGTYMILLRALHGERKYLFSLPPLMLVWANTHMGFFTGLILILLAGGELILQYLFKRNTETLRKVGTLIPVAILSGFATLLNPFGYRIYIEIYRHMLSPLNIMIAEWTAPSSFHIFVIVAVFITILILRISRKSLSFFEILTLLFVTVLALMARRNLPLFFLISGAQLLSLIPFPLVKIHDDTHFLLMPFIGAGVISVLVFQIHMYRSFYESINSDCQESTYPCQALEEYPELSGNVFAPYEAGGYMIWKYPDLKVFSDGRMPAWTDEQGESPYTVFLHIVQTQPGWNEKLRETKTDYLLIGSGTFLGLLLHQDAAKYGWKNVYENESQVIYKNILPYR